jgi:YVTN family beta-propeller protein
VIDSDPDSNPLQYNKEVGRVVLCPSGVFTPTITSNPSAASDAQLLIPPDLDKPTAGRQDRHLAAFWIAFGLLMALALLARGRRKQRNAVLASAVLVLTCWIGCTCGGGSEPNPPPQSTSPDGGSPDGGSPDGGVPDGGAPDGGVPDGGAPDGGVPDGGAPDGGVPDGGAPDSGVPDSGVPDGGRPDGGQPGPGCSGRVPIGIANSPRIPFAYVTNSGSHTISVVSASPQIGDEHPVLHTIPVGPGKGPSWVGLNRNQDFIFVLNQDDRSVSVVNTISNSVIAGTTDPIGTPSGIGMAPDGTLTFVTSPSDDTIYSLDINDTHYTNGKMPVVNAIKLGQNPQRPDWACQPVGTCKKPRGIAIHPDNFKAYVANSGDSTISVVDMHYNSATRYTEIEEIAFAPGKNPVGVGVNHVGDRTYVMNSDDTVSVLDTMPGSSQYHKVLATIRVGRGPLSVAFGPIDAHAYVSNSLEDTVSVINTTANTVLTTVKVGLNPQQVFINLGERTAAYVANKGSKTVSIIDIQAANRTFNQVLDTVTVELAPMGVVLTEP